MTSFSVVVEDDGVGGHVIRVCGDLDVWSAARLTEALAAVPTAHGAVTVDLSKVGFIDSTGVGALVAALKRLRADGRTMVLSKPSRRVRTMLAATGLSRVFTVEA